MQRRLLKSAYSSLSASVESLEILKTADIKSRKTAKPSAKSKWTKRINATTGIIKLVRTARRDVRSLPRRVA
jgi:hypothetical protein